MASFKGYKRSIVIDMDISSVKKSVPEVNKEMALLNSEYRKASEEMKATGTAMDKLSLQHDKLSKQLTLQGDKVKILKEELNRLKDAEGNNEKAIQRKTIELKNAETQYAKTQNEIKSTNKELEKQSGILGVNAEDWDKYTSKTKELGTSLTRNVTLPIVAAGAAAFKMASDMDETMNKVEVIFGNNTKLMTTWASNSIEKMGLASQTALDMAAKYGDMSNSMGLSATKSLQLSQNVTQLAADMASFKNVSIDIADTALTAIWTGETESLKSLGIVMTQANLQRFAASEGIRKNVQDMTDSEKIMLRYNYIVAQTGSAQGDFARTSDSASNQMRMFKENLKQLGASFGEFVVPMITPMLDFLNNMLKGFAGLSDGTKKTITTIAMLAAVIGPLLLIVGKVAETIVNVSGAMKALSGIGSLFNSTVGNATYITFLKWAGIIIAVVAAVTALVIAINYLIGRGSEMNSAIGDITGSMGNVQNSMNQQMQNSTRRAYAIGTNYHPGGMALVGEYGPEEIELPTGTKVKNARDTAKNTIKQDNRGIESRLDVLINETIKLQQEIRQQPKTQQQLLRMGVV